MNVRDLLFSLVNYTIKGEAINKSEVEDSVSAEKLGALFKVSKGHDVAHLVGVALLENGISLEGELEQSFFQEIEKAKLRYEMMRADCLEIYELFDSNNIDYMPLKGAVVRKYYREPWMRTSCDIDILVRYDDLQRAKELLVSELKYRLDSAEEYHDISLYSPFGMHLELHYSICENNNKYDKILERVWEFAYSATQNGRKYALEEPYFLFHMIAHTAYHFACGGCGLRSVLDIWILLVRAEFEREALFSLLKEGGLFEFFEKISELAEYWFGKRNEVSELVLEMEKHILLGGTYGTSGRSVAFKSAKKGGKFKYFMSRIFMPYESLAILYPVIKKHKILTPFCQVARWFGVIFKSKRIAKEMKKIAAADKSQIEDISAMLDKLGL